MYKLRVTLLLALCAAALLGGSASAAAQPAKKPAKVSAVKLATLRDIGVSDNVGMYDSPDPGQPAEVAQKIQDLGMNTERLYKRWDPAHPLPSGNDLRQLCNAATQASLHGITNLIFALPPLPDRQPMDDPSRASYYAAWQSYFADLFDPVSGCVSGNGYWDGVQVPKLDHIYAEPLNESNDLDFCQPQTDTTHDLCADLAVQMRAYIYPLLHQLGQQYGVQVIVVGGALSSHHDPKGYIQAECSAMQRHGITGPNMDMYAIHPYQLSGTGSKGFLSGFTLFQKLQPLIQKCYGSLPLIIDEAGQETSVPDGLGYSCSTPANFIPYSDTQRAWDYQLMLNLARKMGAVGLVNFMLQDEPCLKGWQSGFYYWNGQPKPNLSDIRSADMKALGLS